MINKITILFSLAVVVAGSAWAGNGNMLHGFGPVNSSMGGAGAGVWVGDPVGALAFNPALMSASSGNHISFGTEIFWDDPKFETTLTDGTTGTGNPSTEPGILPSFGYTYHALGSKWAFGFGLIGIAGFRTDNPEDPDSILFASPEDGGFGRIYTDHRVTKIPLAASYQATEKLALGLALNGYIAELAIAPLPYEVIDQAVVDGRIVSYYPQGDGMVKSYAVSLQPSFYYQVNDTWSFGGSYTTEQDFDDFEWNSTFANPHLIDDAGERPFGRARTLSYDLDGPAILTLGVGANLNDNKTQVAVDVSYIKYDGVAGFGSPGGIIVEDGMAVVQPFGWDNVWAFKIGVQHKMNNKVTVRAGYNYSDIPIPPENTLTATGAPAFFQHHFALGAGVQLTKTLTADLGFYYVPESTSEGPLLAPTDDFTGVTTNGTIKESNSLIAALFGLRWQF